MPFGKLLLFPIELPQHQVLEAGFEPTTYGFMITNAFDPQIGGTAEDRTRTFQWSGMRHY